MAKIFYSLSEAAAEINSTVEAMRRAADRGTLLTEKLGSQRVVTAGELERYRTERLGKKGPRPGTKQKKA